MCKDTYALACQFQTRVMSLLEELGFTFNEKLQPPAQHCEFISMGWDTVNCTRGISTRAGQTVRQTRVVCLVSARRSSPHARTECVRRIPGYGRGVGRTRSLARGCPVQAEALGHDAPNTGRSRTTVLAALTCTAVQAVPSGQARCPGHAGDGCQCARLGVHAQDSGRLNLGHSLDLRALQTRQAANPSPVLGRRAAPGPAHVLALAAGQVSAARD
eukprot:1062712-Rhodomonas_salina.2